MKAVWLLASFLVVMAVAVGAAVATAGAKAWGPVMRQARSVRNGCDGFAPHTHCVSNWTFVDQWVPCLCKWPPAEGYVTTTLDHATATVALALAAPHTRATCWGACTPFTMRAHMRGRCRGTWPLFLGGPAATSLQVHRTDRAGAFRLDGYWDGATLLGAMTCVAKPVERRSTHLAG